MALNSSRSKRKISQTTAAFQLEDLSSRARLFRSKLIEEFRVAEHGGAFGEKDEAGGTSKYTTTDLFPEDDPDKNVFHNFLRKTPHELVMFKDFNREENTQTNVERMDKRLVRVTKTIPIGVWARWVVSSKIFNAFIMFLILTNAVLQGVPTLFPESDYRLFHQETDPNISRFFFMTI
eukprot:843960_1